jgi:hypothetical protein
MMWAGVSHRLRTRSRTRWRDARKERKIHYFV